MREKIQGNYLAILIPLLIALISVFVLSGPASSPEFHKDSLAELEEKQTTVLELSAASAAASAAMRILELLGRMITASALTFETA